MDLLKSLEFKSLGVWGNLIKLGWRLEREKRHGERDEKRREQRGLTPVSSSPHKSPHSSSPRKSSSSKGKGKGRARISSPEGSPSPLQRKRPSWGAREDELVSNLGNLDSKQREEARMLQSRFGRIFREKLYARVRAVPRRV